MGTAGISIDASTKSANIRISIVASRQPALLFVMQYKMVACHVVRNL